MVDQGVLQGNWNHIRGKLREKWGELTDDDVARFDGNVEQLVGRIQKKTGEARQAVERFLDQIASDGSKLAQRAEAIATQAAEQVRQAGQRVRDSLNDGYARAETTVKARPAQSVLTAFGFGLAVGVCVTLLLGRDRHSESLWSRSRDSADHWARRAFDTLAAKLQS